jgi:hypothetical protein
MADWGMRIFRAGLAEDAWDSPQELKRFQNVESQLDELRSTYTRTKPQCKSTRKPFEKEDGFPAPTWNRLSTN